MASKPKRPILFFDIETGGLKATENSVLSISYLRNGRQAKNFFSAPAPGSTVSSWASANVLGPIQQRLAGRAPLTEERSLNRFLRVLEAQQGGTIAGWNIGYVPSAQSASSRGFDIPFIMSRAEKYPGLADRYRSAFSNVNIRDLGREHAVHMAGEVSKHPDLIDKKLFEQARSFTDLVKINKATQRLNTTEDIARWMGTPGQYGGYEVAGWKLKSTYKHLFGSEFANQHFSESDVEATAKIFNEGNLSKLTGPGFATAWNKEALINKAEASARTAAGLSNEEKIVGRAGALVGESMVNVGRKMFQIGMEHKGIIGLGALAAGLYMAKPLSMFSGKDDSYNTIEGLSHGGHAEKKRRQMTDFGSGYQGDQSYETRVKDRFSLFKQALKKYGLEEGTGHKRIFIPKEDLSEEQITDVLGFVPVSIAIPEAGQSKVESYRNPHNLFHIHEHGANWTLHEDRDPAATMLVKKYFIDKEKQNSKTSILTPIAEFFKGIPHAIQEGVPGAYYYLKGQLMGGESMLSRLQRDLPEEYEQFLNYLKPITKKNHVGSLLQRVKNKISGKDDAHNTIEGLSHKGIAKDSRPGYNFGSGWLKKIVNFFVQKEKSVVSSILKTGTKSAVPGAAKNFAIPASELGLLSQTTIRKQLGMSSIERAVEDLIPSAHINAKAEIFGVPGTGFGPGEAFANKSTLGPLIPSSSSRIEQLFGHRVISNEIENVGEFQKALPEAESVAAKPSAKLAKQRLATESQIARFKESWYNKHKQAQVMSSVNTINPGRRHRGTAGKIVQ